MQRYIILGILLTVFQFSAYSQARVARVKFDKQAHNFGTINEADGKVSYKFEFANTGEVPLIITNVDASCGCTTPVWTKTPVMPGQRGFVTTEFDPANTRTFNKTITVYTNGAPERVILRVLGEVIPKDMAITDIYKHNAGNLLMRSRHIPFSLVSGNQVRTETVGVYNNTEQAMQLDFGNLPDYIRVEANPVSLAPKTEGQFVITFDPEKIDKKGFVKENIPIRINNKEEYPTSLKISATLE